MLNVQTKPMSLSWYMKIQRQPAVEQKSCCTIKILLSIATLTALTAVQSHAWIQTLSAKLGEEFKIKNTSGHEVTVSIVERAGKPYIRSRYHHGFTSEIREYAVSNSIESVSTSECAITIFFSPKTDPKLVGAVYVINNHGEAVK